MRGEKRCRNMIFLTGQGSPPHARGKGHAGQVLVGVVRITPACAGKRERFWWLFFHSRDHPRMRGEKCASCTAGRKIKGSPPHARGKAPPPLP